MDRETILLVHPEADQLDRIEALVQPLGLETRRTHDFPGAVKLWQIRPANLVVCTDIDVPEHKPQVVEGVRRATSRLPVVVLITDRSEEECPKATRLLTGLQQYLAWPQEAADLPAVARALLAEAYCVLYEVQAAESYDWASRGFQLIARPPSSDVLPIHIWQRIYGIDDLLSLLQQ